MATINCTDGGIISVSGVTTLSQVSFGKMVVCSGSSAYTVTLPSHLAGNVIEFSIITTSNALVTLSPASGTIDGQTNSVYGSHEGGFLYDDGTNYHTVSEHLQPVSFLVTLSASQTIANASDVKLHFNTKSFDIGGFFDAVTNFRFTPLYPGKYEYTLYTVFTGNTGGGDTEASELGKNGTIVSNNTFIVPSPGLLGTTTNGTPNLSFIGQMNGSTDYLEAFARINSGSTLQVNNSAVSTFFYGKRISRF